METKPSIYTSEFWITILTNIFSLVNLLGLWDYVPNRWSVIAMTAVNALYAISRGQAKSGVAPDPGAKANKRLFLRP